MIAKLVLMAELERPSDFGAAVASVEGSHCSTLQLEGGTSMTFSALHHWKEPTTRCSICGCSVTLELSKTDERGKAVHECCYVNSLKFRMPIHVVPQSLAITPIDPVQNPPEIALAGMLWRIFGLVRL
jgi:hypothetical protein